MTIGPLPIIRILLMSSRRGTFLFPTAYSLKGSYKELTGSQPSIPDLRNPHSSPQHSRSSVQTPGTDREIDTCKLRQRIAEKSRVVEDAPKPHAKRACCPYHSHKQNLLHGPVTAFFPQPDGFPSRCNPRIIPRTGSSNYR